jgi:hypothetical protein
MAKRTIYILCCKIYIVCVPVLLNVYDQIEVNFYLCKTCFAFRKQHAKMNPKVSKIISFLCPKFYIYIYI